MMNKVARYKGSGTGNKITKEAGFIYSNENGITFITDSK